MTVYLLNGTVREHRGCKGRVHDDVLYVVVERPYGYGSADTKAAYPLTSVERWEPGP